MEPEPQSEPSGYATWLESLSVAEVNGPRCETAVASSLLAAPAPVSVPIASLVSVGSPRSGGINVAHVERLAEAELTLPPILIHGSTMRIVDGVHRVAAALLLGRTAIQAHLLEGSLEAAFVIAVRANVTHGLPLPLADRRAAVQKIMEFHADWSDRAIAAATGLSARTVGDIRSTEAVAGLSAKRRGRDGRLRPLNAAAGRQLAAEIISWRPKASLREIAGMAGVSPTTVRDVRDRLARGEDPVPIPQRAGSCSVSGRQAKPPRPDASAPADVSGVLSTLSRDPALRMNAAGRDLLRWLHLHAVHPVDSERVAQTVPDHCVEHIAEVAQRCAANWALIARTLAERPD
jgi:ParB-like chromosome segregation protein Spo0J